MRLVVDTNVIVSALMSTNGIPAKILSLIFNGKLHILYDNRIVFEYAEVLSRKGFGFSEEMVSDLIDYFKREGEYINAEHINTNFSDETDKKFYEVFKSGNAGYLITGNIKHFPKEDAIVIPKDFMQIYTEPLVKPH